MEFIYSFKNGYTTEKLELEIMKTKDGKKFVIADGKIIEFNFDNYKNAPNSNKSSSQQESPPVSPTSKTKKKYKKCSICTDDCKMNFKTNDCGCTFHLKCIKKNCVDGKCKCGQKLSNDIVVAMMTKKKRKVKADEANESDDDMNSLVIQINKTSDENESEELKNLQALEELSEDFEKSIEVARHFQ